MKLTEGLKREIEDAIRALEIAENQFNHADPEHRASASRRLTAAMEDYNAAIAAAKADASIAVNTLGAATSAGVRFFAALSESRSLFCPEGLDRVGN